MPGIGGILCFEENRSRFEIDFKRIASHLSNGDETGVREFQGDFFRLAVSHPDPDVLNLKVVQSNQLLCIIEGEVFPRLDADVSDFNVVNLFERYGTEFTDKVKGWFNICIVDMKKEEVYLINSRSALRPLYLLQFGNSLYFSSDLESLYHAGETKRIINKNALIQYFLFNYPLGEHTFFKDVVTLPPASVLKYNARGKTSDTYWDSRSLFIHEPESRKYSIDLLNEKFRQVIWQYVKGVNRLGVSLTGGFDGRTILSHVLGLKKKPVIYTFGRKKSDDVVVAGGLCQKLGLTHEVIDLNRDYLEGHFLDNARDTVHLTAASSTMLRAHYTYAFRIICQHIDIALTGNFGSELLRPIHSVGEIFSPVLKSLVTPGDVPDIRSLKRKIRATFNFSVDNKIEREIEEFTTDYSAAYPGVDPNQRFFLFTLDHVFRKYFGPETKLADNFIVSRYPYLDDEFVEAICRTEFCGGYRKMFNHNPIYRRKSQLFYAGLLEKNGGDCFTFSTAKGYSPRTLFSKTGYLQIVPAYLKNKFGRRGEDMYNLDKGIPLFYNETERVFESEFVKRYLTKAGSHDVLFDNLTSGKRLSLGYWLNELEKTKH